MFCEFGFGEYNDVSGLVCFDSGMHGVNSVAHDIRRADRDSSGRAQFGVPLSCRLM